MTPTAKGNALQAVKNKPRLLRVLSNKSAHELSPDLREDMLEYLTDRPDMESITRHFGSTTLQVILSALWTLSCRQQRMERLLAQSSGVRNGFGQKVVAMNAVPQRKPVQSQLAVRQIKQGAAA